MKVFIYKKLKKKVFLNYNSLLLDITKFELNSSKVYQIFKSNYLSTFWFNNIFKKDNKGDNNWAKRIFILYLIKDNLNIHLDTDDNILYKLVKINFSEVSITLKKKVFYSNLNHI